MMDLDKLHVCFNQSTDHTSRSIDLFIDNNNKAVTDRRLRPRCCHLGSYCKRPKNSKNVIVSCTFSVFYSALAKRTRARGNHVFACNFAKYSPIKKMTRRLRNIPFLIWLLTTPPHLKYVATLPCNLSLMACFADINVGTVATCKVGWDFQYPFNCNFFKNRLIFDRIVVMSLWPGFLAHPAEAGR